MVKHVSQPNTTHPLSKDLSARMQRSSLPFAAKTLYLGILLAFSQLVNATPENPRVVTGNAEFHEAQDTFTVEQHSDTVVIDYDEFNIETHERVMFEQPSSHSIAVNRVTGANPSKIFGQLDANGQVFLINRNGVLFSENARINVGALGVSTLDLNEPIEFDRLSFSDNGIQSNASIRNYGDIHAHGQRAYVTLLSPNILNTGEIYAESGEVNLHAANQAIVTLSGDLVGIESHLDQDGQIQNLGDIQAGHIVLSASSADSLIGGVIQNSGVISLTQLIERDGKIMIEARHGDIINEGRINASAQEADNNGGEITLKASRIALQGQISTDAQGNGNGGTIRVTSDNLLVITDESLSSANADQGGSGGLIRYYSHENTYFDPSAHISSTGGRNSGDGGFVEVSGHIHVEARGSVDTRALNTDGQTGIYLIDPTDLILTNSSNNGSFTGTGPFSWTPIANPSNIDVANITANLAMNNVLIDSNQGGAGPSGSIRLITDLDINGSGTNELRLNASNDILFTSTGRIFDSNPGTIDAPRIVLTSTSNLTMDPLSSIDLGAGTLNANAGLVTLASITTTNTSDNSISITSGNVIQDAGTNAINLTSAGGVVINANAGIGTTTNPIETDVNAINLTNGTFSEIAIVESDSLEIKALTASVDVSITTIGGATDILTLPDTAISTTANMNLNTAGDIRSLNGRSLTINATSLDLTAGNLATATTLNSRIDSLNLNLASTASLSVINTDGIVLNDAIMPTANLGLSATSGNINISSLTSVNDFSASATSGNITLPDAGLSPSGDITLSANDIIDISGRSLTLNGLNGKTLNIHAEDPADDITINTSDTLHSLQISMGSAATQGYIVNHSNTDLNFIDINVPAGSVLANVSNASVTIAAATAVNQLSLNAPAGTIQVPDSGITTTDALTLNAQDLNDIDAGAITLAATLATIDLNAPASPLTLNTTLDNLNIRIGNASALGINESNALILDDVVLTGGDVSITLATGDLTSSSISNANNVSMSVPNGNLTLSSTGLNANNNLDLRAQDLRDTDIGIEMSDIILSASSINIDLSAAAADLTLNSNTDALDLIIQNSQSFTLNEANDIELRNIALSGGDLSVNLAIGDLQVSNASGAANILLNTANGRITVPASGLNASSSINTFSNDIKDTNSGLLEREILMNAPTINIQAQLPNGAITLNGNFSTLRADIGGSADLIVNHSGALTVSGEGIDGNAIQIRDGNLNINNTGSLTILDAIIANDASDDGLRAGQINIDISDGDISLGGSSINRSSSIQSYNRQDSNTVSTLNTELSDTLSIRISNRSSTSDTYDISLGNGVNTSQIDAQGGDILIESVRDISIATNTSLRAFDTVPTATGGEVIDNSTQNFGLFNVESTRIVQVQANLNSIQIPNPSASLEDLIDSTLEETIELETPPVKHTIVPSRNLNSVFSFPSDDCSTNNAPETVRQCHKNALLKTFLGQLWINSELPPTEENK